MRFGLTRGAPTFPFYIHLVFHIYFLNIYHQISVFSLNLQFFLVIGFYYISLSPFGDKSRCFYFEDALLRKEVKARQFSSRCILQLRNTAV